jgi:hypothetical protein
MMLRVFPRALRALVLLPFIVAVQLAGKPCPVI